MEPIKTSNFISTPNIEGNIGSCTLSSNTIQTKGGMFIKEFTATQVNSCTGKVINQSTYLTYENLWVTIIFGVPFLFFCIFMCIGAYFEGKGEF